MPMKRLAFIILTVLLSFGLAIFLSPPAHAARNWVDEDYATCMDAAVETDDTCSPAFTSHQVSSLINNGVRLLVGPVPGVTTNSKDKGYLRQMQEKSMIGGLSRTIAMVYAYPPASFGTWVADVGQTLGFIPKSAYAQGIGFSGLAPLLPIWKAFRNIAYLVLAIVMIVIGFMVMLRKKIDPKTVVTVQNALPRIVMTLILITFSYAIVGFLIDLMYLVILLVVTVVGGSMKNANIPELQAAFTAGGFGEVTRIFGPLTIFAPNQGSEIISYGILSLLVPPIGLSLLVSSLSGGLAGGTNFSGNLGTSVGFFSPLLLLLLSFALLVTFIRILFILFNAYIQVVVSLIFGPLQLMLDAIPGGNGFASWLSSLIVNLLTFPVTIALIVVGIAISSNISTPNFWSPPLVPKIPNSAQFIQALIGFGVIMSIPTVVNAIKEALKIKPLVPASSGVLTQPITGALGTILQFGSQFYYLGAGVSFLGKIFGDKGGPPKVLGDEHKGG